MSRLVPVVLAGCVLACGEGQRPTAPSGVVIQSPAPEPPPAPPPEPYSKGQYTGPAIVAKDNGQPYTAPRPTILVFAVDAVTTLQTGQRYSDVADLLIPQGWLAVSTDLPAHGADVRAGESPTTALTSWAKRFESGENIVPPFVAKVSAILDGLIAAKWTDPNRIAVMGVSRGGFLAMHVAATDSRVDLALGIVPVTDLRALTEFADQQNDDGLAASVRLPLMVTQLSRVPIWLETPQVDTRVSAHLTVALAEELRMAGGSVALHVEPGNVHTVPPMPVIESAATWVQMMTQR